MDPSSGNLGVATCVAGVVAAFHDAETLVQRLKQLRAHRGLQAPPLMLEDAIYQASEDIDRQQRRCVERLGYQFEQGDFVAVIALQQVTIELRSSLLERLRHDNETTDFMALADQADSLRDQTISALISLRQRLVNAGSSTSTMVPTAPSLPPAQPLLPSVQPAPPFEQAPSPSMQHRSDVVQPSRTNVYPPPHAHQPEEERLGFYTSIPPQPLSPPPPPPPPRPHYRATQESLIRRPVGSVEPVSPLQATEFEPLATSLHPDSAQRRHSSLLGGLLRRNQTRGGRTDRSPEPTQRRASASSAAPSSKGLGIRTHSGNISQIAESHPAGNFTFREVDHNQYEIYAPDPLSPELYRRDTRTSSMSGKSTNSDAASTAPTTASASSTGVHAVKSLSPRPAPPNHSSSQMLTTPNKENDYLGFCKGAWKAQNDDPKAWTERRDFTMAASNTITYPSCNSCAFRGHIPSEVIWKRIFVDEKRGLKYRQAFLAKSHVKQKNVTDKNYAYLCLFCTFAGQKERVVYSQNTYLDHISQEHRDGALDEVVLYRTRCISDRVCSNNEKFDINLLPTTETIDAGGINDDRARKLSAAFSVVELAA